MQYEEIDYGLNLRLPMRHRLLDPGRPHVLLSSGYSIFGFEEPIQVALIEALDELGVGWLQYSYLERLEEPRLDDLLVSTGLAAARVANERLEGHGVNSPVLFGISFGANISLELALVKAVSALLLVNTVFDYSSFRRRQLGDDAFSDWERRGYVDLSYPVGSLRSSYRFVVETARQDLATRASRIVKPILAFQGDADAVIPTSHVLDFSRLCTACRPVIVKGADHAFAGSDAISSFLGEAQEFLRVNNIGG